MKNPFNSFNTKNEMKNKKEIKPYPYQYYADQSERHDIYQFSKELSQYLHKEKIPNIVMMDRSARLAWVGVDEYWKEKYKDEKKPNIYFVDPKRFDYVNKVYEENNFSALDAYRDRLNYQNNGKLTLEKEFNEAEEKLKQEFKEIFKNLEKDKDKPIALFDTCIHSGTTLIPVVSFFNKNGFEDIKVIVADDDRDQSTLLINKSLNKNTMRISCHPFGYQYNPSGVVRKDNITSSYDPKSADRDVMITSRHEIRQIIKDKGI